MLVTDGEGLPIGFLVESAQESEVCLAERTLATVQVGRRKRPRLLICDRGYDSRTFRRHLRRRGVRSCIPMRQRPKSWKPRRGRPPVADPAYYRQRWKVERTFAWLLSNRRVVVRWEHHVGIYEKVLNAFAQSNRDLAADLDLDLKQYGYYYAPPAPCHKQMTNDTALLQVDST